ncbi:hypothetical protein KY285_001139 [Solanum tuberosum]|nr:hypothetical protein KY285_001139 [Solanum tuberosum]
MLQMVFIPPPECDLPSLEGPKPKKNKNTFKPVGNATVVKSTSMLTTRPTTYKLRLEIYEYRRNNHLFLDRPGHQCKMKQLNCQIGELEPNQVVEEANVEVEDITLYIIIEGTVKNRNLAILIDSGSTYKFIDEGNVKETGHKVSYCPLVKVTVADRNYVMCTSHCQEFSWKMKDIPN